jgi:hypothetical protein
VILGFQPHGLLDRISRPVLIPPEVALFFRAEATPT